MEGRREDGLEVQVGDPVDQVEEAKRSGEEDAGVGVYLGDTDVESAVTPGTRATVLEAAKEAGAVLPVQALVAILFVTLLHVCGVVHLDGGGRAWTDIHRGCLLWTRTTNRNNDNTETQSVNNRGDRP